MTPHRAARRRVVVALAIVLLLGACSSGSEPAAGYTIGLVTNNPNGMRNIDGFVEAMAGLGYVDGENVTYLSRGEPLSGDDLDGELEAFVTERVDLVFTAGTPTGVAAYRITSDTGIPVVFGVIADPLAAGVMADLTHPGGNMTGVKLGEHQDRRLELLLEIAPSIERVYVPYNPDDTAAAAAVAQIAEVADGLGVELMFALARTDEEVSRAIERMTDAIDAIFLVPDSTVNARLPDIVSGARRLQLPVSGPSTAQVEEGAFMTYGFIHAEAGAQAARIADQVLRGANPGDLPVENTESFLALNLAVAEEIGLSVPDGALQQAEIIIRHNDAEDSDG